MSSPRSQTRSSKAKAKEEATAAAAAKSNKADPIAVIQAELNNLIAKSSGEKTSPSPSKGKPTTALITATSECTTYVQPSSSEVSVSSGRNTTQVITLPPGSPVGKTIQNIVKRSMPSSSAGQVTTKMIITRNPSGKQSTSTTALTSSTVTKMSTVATNQNTAVARQILKPGSPVKFVPITKQGVGQTKGFMMATSPAKPTSGIITKGPIPIRMSPMKSPTGAAPPKKIAPGPAPVAQTIIVKEAATAKKSEGGISLTSVSGVKTIAVVANAPMNPVQQPKPHPIKSGVKLAPSTITTTPAAVAASKTAKILPSSTKTSTVATTVQPVQVPGSKFSYIRLVTVTASSTATTQLVTTAAKQIAPATLATTLVDTIARPVVATNPVKINIPIAPAQPIRVSAPQLMSPGPSTTQNRMIMPANAQVKIINPVTGETKFAAFPPGTTLLAPSGNILQSFAMVPMVPQQVVTQAKPISSPNYVSLAPSSQIPPVPTPRQRSPPPTSRAVNGRRSTSTPVDTDHRPRKPCNCTKSQCLKLYCDCFANGEFCNNCNCNNCYNNLGHEDDRARAIKLCLDRNPNAFKPKIGKGRNGELDRRHNKGCNCKRSGCLKNYCECYEAKILCSNNCKCVGCKNFEESPERKTLMHLADAAEVRVQQQTDANTKLLSQFQDLPSRPAAVNDSGERLPFSFITNEVAEATCQCLLAQAEQTEQKRHPQATAERLILEEFGQCLRQVIKSASKTKVVTS